MIFAMVQAWQNAIVPCTGSPCGFKDFVKDAASCAESQPMLSLIALGYQGAMQRRTRAIPCSSQYCARSIVERHVRIDGPSELILEILSLRIGLSKAPFLAEAS